MIVVNAAANERLSVFVKDEPAEVTAILNSLLGAKLNVKSSLYYLPVSDFPIFREKLDRLGVVNGREMDEAAASLIQKYTYRLELNEQIKAGALNGEIQGLLSNGNLKSTPWSDQLSDVRLALRSQVLGIFSEMGTGKSNVVLTTFALLKAVGMAKYMLIITPNATKANWLRQTTQHTTLTVSEMGNGKQQLMRRLKSYEEGRTDVCVVHYEALRDQTFRDALVKLPFDVVACDEAHLIKNQNDRSKALLDTVSRIRPAVDLVEADIELEDGTITKAILPAGVKPGEFVDFW